LETNGSTHAEISRGGTQCVDDVPHKSDILEIERKRILFHPGGEFSGVFADFLANRCGGPLEADVIMGDALLTGRLPAHPERHRTLHIGMALNGPFTSSAGITGSVDASVTLVLRRSR
jgi:hypothetical protein